MTNGKLNPGPWLGIKRTHTDLFTHMTFSGRTVGTARSWSLDSFTLIFGTFSDNTTGYITVPLVLASAGIGTQVYRFGKVGVIRSLFFR